MQLQGEDPKSECSICFEEKMDTSTTGNMQDIWYAVLYMIVILEDDVPLLSHLLDKRGFHLTEPYPFELGCQFLTGETDVKEGAKVWEELPVTVRQKMKATFLKAQDIEWDSANQSYVTRF